MHSVGEKLRNERQRQNRSLSAIASETCILVRYLEAIEQDDLSVLPGGFFYKSFVKQYAAVLELDYQTVESDVEKILPAEVQDPLPALSTSYRVAKTEGRISLFPNRAVWAGALLVVTLAGAGGLYAWWQNSQGGPGDASPEPVRAVQAALTPEPVIQPPPAAVEPPAATAVPEAAAVVTAETPRVKHRRRHPSPIIPNSRSAYRRKKGLRSRFPPAGKNAFSGVLDARQTRSTAGLENAKLESVGTASRSVR